MKKRIKRFLQKVITTVRRPEMQILPGQLAFFFMLSIIPLIAVLGSIAQSFSISTEAVQQLISSAVPSEVIDLLMPIISGKSVNINMIIFYISAFILASNGPNSMIISSNLLYKDESKDAIYRRIKAILMTFILVILLVFVLLVPAFGDFIVKAIKEAISNNSIKETLQITYNILKYPISFLLIYMNIKLLYTIAPDKNIKSRETTYGAIFTSIGWMLATEIYSIYVGEFAKYNLFYGSISNILILLLWVYMLAYIFVLGMALNSSSIKKET